MPDIPMANVQDMHAPQFKTPGNAERNTFQTPEEKKLFARCMQYLDEGKKHRDMYSQKWELCRKYLYGDQWYDRKRPSYRSSPVINVIWPIINTILPIMTDIHPGFDVGPREPSDYKFAEMLSRITMSWWENNGISMVIEEALWDSLTITHGVLKAYWDPTMSQGEGEERVIAVDPGCILVPRRAIDFQTNCPWVGHVMRKSVGEMRRLFPEHAEAIRGTGKGSCLNSSYSGADSSDGGNKSRAMSGDIVLVSPTDRKSPTGNLTDVQGTGSGGDDDEVEFIEFWCDDWSTEDSEGEPDDQGNPGEPIKKRRFPNGRLTTIVPELNLILQDVQNPRADGRKPFVRVVDQTKPREFAGIGDVEPLIETQRYINKFWAVIMDWANSMTNPVWVIDNTSGVSPRMITNQVGLVLVKNPGSDVRRMDAPGLPPQIFESYTSLRELADTQSGIHDVTSGRRPTGITAAEAIDELQEAAQTRIRLKDRNLEAAMTDLGQLVICDMLQNYREPRIVKIAGSADGWPKFFEFYIADDQESGGYQMNTRQHDFNEDTGEYIAQDWNNSGVSKGIYDIQVKSGTSLPYQKNRRASEARSMYRDGLIDRKAALESMDYPNYEDVLRRMEEMEAAAAQAQAGPQPGGM